MHIALAALFFFAILTLWVPAYWPVTIFQVAVFVLAGITICRTSRAQSRFSWPLVPLAFAICCGWAQLLTGGTAYAFATTNAVVQWATFLAVFLIACCLFGNEDVRRWFRSAMLWFAFLLSIVAILQTFTSGGRVFWLFPSGYTDFVMGPILYHNHYAAFIEAVLPIAVYEAVRREHRTLVYAVMAATLYASVIASASRAGSVLSTVEIVAVIAIMWLRGLATGRVIGLSVVGIGTFCTLFVLIVGPEVVWDRFQEPASTVIRWEFAKSSIQMIVDHPWFGLGLGTWPTVYPRYAVTDFGLFANQAHSDWLQWTAEGGVPLGLMLATLLVWCLRPAFRSVWGLGVVAVFLHAIVDYPFSRPALGSWTILLIAMLAANTRSSSRAALHARPSLCSSMTKRLTTNSSPENPHSEAPGSIQELLSAGFRAIARRSASVAL